MKIQKFFVVFYVLSSSASFGAFRSFREFVKKPRFLQVAAGSLGGALCAESFLSERGAKRDRLKEERILKGDLRKQKEALKEQGYLSSSHLMRDLGLEELRESLFNIDKKPSSTRDIHSSSDLEEYSVRVDLGRREMSFRNASEKFFRKIPSSLRISLIRVLDCLSEEKGQIYDVDILVVSDTADLQRQMTYQSSAFLPHEKLLWHQDRFYQRGKLKEGSTSDYEYLAFFILGQENMPEHSLEIGSTFDSKLTGEGNGSCCVDPKDVELLESFVSRTGAGYIICQEKRGCKRLVHRRTNYKVRLFEDPENELSNPYNLCSSSFIWPERNKIVIRISKEKSRKTFEDPFCGIFDMDGSFRFF